MGLFAAGVARKVICRHHVHLLEVQLVGSVPGLDAGREGVEEEEVATVDLVGHQEVLADRVKVHGHVIDGQVQVEVYLCVSERILVLYIA